MNECCPHVYIVIPVHDRIGYTLTCIQSLARQSYRNFTIVVADGGSTDGTAGVLAERHPDVVVLAGTDEWWWTAATNAGVRWALERASLDDYVLTMNNDTTVAPGYLASLVAAASSFEDAIVGSVAVDSRDGDTIADGGPHVSWKSAKSWTENAGESLMAVRASGADFVHVDMLAGRGTLIPVKCFLRVGLFDEVRLPHYAADYEFSVRALRAGYQLVMSYRAPISSMIEATGVNTLRGPLPWRAFVGMFFSRRSAACLAYRWRYAKAAGPQWYWPVYLVADTVRVVGGGLRDQLELGQSGPQGDGK